MILVLLYSAKISWIGTSGVGPFIDDSNGLFCEFWRSVTRCGIATSKNSDTISSFLYPNLALACSSEKEREACKLTQV